MADCCGRDGKSLGLAETWGLYVLNRCPAPLVSLSYVILICTALVLAHSKTTSRSSTSNFERQTVHGNRHSRTCCAPNRRCDRFRRRELQSLRVQQASEPSTPSGMTGLPRICEAATHLPLKKSLDANGAGFCTRAGRRGDCLVDLWVGLARSYLFRSAARLQAKQKLHPDRPVVVLLGSSRTLNGLDLDAVEKASEAAARQWCSAALPFLGRAPSPSTFSMNASWGAGVRPDFIVMEAIPAVLNPQVLELELDAAGRRLTGWFRATWRLLSGMRRCDGLPCISISRPTGLSPFTVFASPWSIRFHRVFCHSICNTNSRQIPWNSSRCTGLTFPRILNSVSGPAIRTARALQEPTRFSCGQCRLPGTLRSAG